MAQMFGGNNSIANMQGNMLPMMFMMNGGFDKMFEGMFDAVGVNTPAAPVVKEDN
jgi:hypothetical protein